MRMWTIFFLCDFCGFQVVLIMYFYNLEEKQRLRNISGPFFFKTCEIRVGP